MIKTVIVEDDLMVASINKQFVLKTPGMEVTAIYHNGKEALEYLRQNGADLILLDMYMPGYDGLELLSQLRIEKIDSDVIMITAANDTEHIKAALTLGIVDYLIKPFQYERFAEAINRFLKKRKTMQNSDSFTQDDIDALLQHDHANVPSSNEELQKGIQRPTMEKILLCLKSHDRHFLASEQIAEETGLSKVTARRYLNYLTDSGKVESRIDYGTGGRPSITYRLL
jgi:response regulator of citrate/malate metabolism